MKTLLAGIALVMMTGSVWAKLPAPSDEAKAKAAEAAAKTAHAGKVDAYLLCKAQDKVAARQNKGGKPKAKEKDDKAAPAALPPCTDPGPFVYTPAAPAPAAGASAPPATPAAAEKPKKP